MKKRDMLLLKAVTDSRISDREFRKFVFRFLQVRNPRESIADAIDRFTTMAIEQSEAATEEVNDWIP